MSMADPLLAITGTNIKHWPLGDVVKCQKCNVRTHVLDFSEFMDTSFEIDQSLMPQNNQKKLPRYVNIGPGNGLVP